MAKLVNWHDFEKKMREKHLVLFSALDVFRAIPVSPVGAAALLYRYAKRGYITRIKQGLYVFPDSLPPDLYMANKLYEPSYVSLEFALSYHGVIPETVYEITSVTPKATRRFETLGKVFSYHRISKKAFTGYAVQKQKGIGYVIADPDKAFVDTLYYRLRLHKKPIDRFNKEKINPARAVKYATLFGNRKLTSIVKATLA